MSHQNGANDGVSCELKMGLMMGFLQTKCGVFMCTENGANALSGSTSVRTVKETTQIITCEARLQLVYFNVKCNVGALHCSNKGSVIVKLDGRK